MFKSTILHIEDTDLPEVAGIENVYELDDLHFVIELPHFDPETGLAEFHYELRGHRFVERLWFPTEGLLQDNADTDSFRMLLDLTAIISGQRYYTLLAPHFIDISQFRLSNFAMESVVNTYCDGLVPFLVRNDLDPKLLFATHEDADTPGHGEVVTGLYLDPGTLLVIGDDINTVVAHALLTRMNADHTLFAVNPTARTRKIAATMGKPLIEIRREHDPLLAQLAAQPGYHPSYACEKPITALIACLAAALYNYRDVATIDDRSPKAEDVVVRDGARYWYPEGNWNFAIAGLAAEPTNNVMRCYPILGPFSPLDVSGKFSRAPQDYDGLFSSCENRDSLSGEVPWCGKCDHCLREFVLMSLFIDDARAKKMFGGNYLERPENIVRYRQLAGLSGSTPHWSDIDLLAIASSLWIYMESESWRDSIVCKALKPALNDKYHRGFSFGRKKLKKTLHKLMDFDFICMTLLPEDVRKHILRDSFAK